MNTDVVNMMVRLIDLVEEMASDISVLSITQDMILQLLHDKEM